MTKLPKRDQDISSILESKGFTHTIESIRAWLEYKIEAQRAYGDATMEEKNALIMTANSLEFAIEHYKKS